MFKIIIADHYGVCFGVRDAIAQAERLAGEAPLTILGELVHNPVVRDRLAARGVTEHPLDEITTAAPARRVMITAHGASDAARRAWASTGHTVADGTCPLVRRAHEELHRLVQQGYFPVVIGQPGHAEVRGLVGDFPDAFVLAPTAPPAEVPAAPRYGVISQTTQPIELVRTIVSVLREAHPQSEVHFCDTVCQPTKNRQLALRKLLREADTIVVIGGRNSNNTLQLVAAATVAGRRVFHVTGPEELDAEWFAESTTVGLTAGTSTLHETVAAVRDRLAHFAAALPQPINL